MLSANLLYFLSGSEFYSKVSIAISWSLRRVEQLKSQTVCGHLKHPTQSYTLLALYCESECYPDDI